jgi:hypothetical protein
MFTAASPASRFRHVERTLVINDTPPMGVLFSHLPADEARSDAPVSRMAHDNLFHEPELPPGAPRADIDVDVDEPAPAARQHDARARPRRPARRRTAA